MAGKDIIGQLLFQAVVHAKPICALLVAAGMLGLFVLPLAERKNFFDENAMLVGSATSNIGCAASCDSAHILLHGVCMLAGHGMPRKAINRHCCSSFELSLFEGMLSCRSYVRTNMPDIAHTAARFAHAMQHNETQASDLLRPLLKLSLLSVPAPDYLEGYCTHLHTIMPSPRGDGSEALALFTPIGVDARRKPGVGSIQRSDAYTDAAALAVGLALTQYLAQVPWLARDFVWVIPDARCGLVESAAQWLQAQQGRLAQSESLAGQKGAGFERAGALQQVRV